MSDEDWTAEVAVPPKKKGIPSWVLFCSGGCLIALVLAVTAGFLLFKQIKSALNPEKQWQRLEEVAQLDARPPQLKLMFGWDLGMDFWMLRDSRGYIVAVYDFGESEASERDGLFSEEFEGGGLPGLSKIEDASLSTVSVQGRTLRVQHFQNTGGFSPGGGEEVKGGGAACFVDITPENDPGFMMLFMMRDPSHRQKLDSKKPEGEKPEGEESEGEETKDPEKFDTPVSSEAIQALLKPFRIGPDHETYIAPGPHPQSGQDEVKFKEVFKD